jgi:hypothetical protein
MVARQPKRTTHDAAGLMLGETVAAALREHLPSVAEHTVAAVTAEVPSYAGALAGEMGRNIENAVQTALGGFLKLASRPAGSDPGTPLGPALEEAYALGRGEARSGRSMDALLAAYRVGARVSWRELADVGVAAGLPADTLARFAELVFAYIDELSAASVAGHSDELTTTGRVRQRYLERLTQLLLAAAPADALVSAAERADWPVPETLTAVVLPEPQVRGLLATLDQRTLQATEDLPEPASAEDVAVLLVPDAGGRWRPGLLQALGERTAMVGPARPWTRVHSSYRRALRGWMLGIPTARPGPADSDEHLVEILLGADEEALSDLRDRALAPLAGLRAGSAEKLTETLRSWLLHRGRREKVAAELFVHPQTVRYRMGQLRELYGDLLDDPATVLELTVALALDDGLRLPSTVVAAGPARLADEADHHEDRGGSR